MIKYLVVILKSLLISSYAFFTCNLLTMVTNKKRHEEAKVENPVFQHMK